MRVPSEFCSPQRLLLLVLCKTHIQILMAHALSLSTIPSNIPENGAGSLLSRPGSADEVVLSMPTRGSKMSTMVSKMLLSKIINKREMPEGCRLSRESRESHLCDNTIHSTCIQRALHHIATRTQPKKNVGRLLWISRFPGYRIFLRQRASTERGITSYFRVAMSSQKHPLDQAPHIL